MSLKKNVAFLYHHSAIYKEKELAQGKCLILQEQYSRWMNVFMLFQSNIIIKYLQFLKFMSYLNIEALFIPRIHLGNLSQLFTMLNICCNRKRKKL